MRATALIVRFSLCATAILLPGTARPSIAAAYCANLPWWDGYTSIPVWRAPDLDDKLRHDNGTVWNDFETDQAIMWVLAAANQYSNAQLPTLIYMGARSPCTGDACQIPNAITVIPNEEAPCRSRTDNTPAEGILIRIQPTAGACERTWEHWENPTTGPTYVFPGVLLHELTHALGLNHNLACAPLDCSTHPCAIMDGDSGTSPELLTYYRDDVLGLRSRYGAPAYYTRTMREFDSSSGTWWTMAPTDWPGFQPLFSLSSSRDATRMFAAYRDPGSLYPRTAMWYWAPIDWEDWGTGVTVTTQGHVGAALDPSTGYGYSFYLRGETPMSVNKWFGYSRHISTTSRANYQKTTPTTRRHGVMAAWYNSGTTLVQVWRATNGAIQVHAVHGSVFEGPWPILDSQGQPARAMDTPSVACGPAGIAHNCLVAWADPAMAGSAWHYHTLRWAHFGLYGAPGSYYVEQGPILSAGYLMHGSPVVAYVGPETSSRAFAVTWSTQIAQTADFEVWTMFKSASETASWWDVTGHGGDRHRLAAALGSSNTDAELVWVRR